MMVRSNKNLQFPDKKEDDMGKSLQLDEHIMARTDAEFRQYVCDALRELKDHYSDLESQTQKHLELTKDIADLVEMGRTLFVFASRLGSILRWIGGVAAGTVFIWQVFSDHIKNVVK